MSNYHVLDSSRRDTVRIAFHIAIPDENNAAGINLQTAASQYLSETITIIPWLQSAFPTEYTQIQNGEIYEYVENIQYNANGTDIQKRNKIDARYTFMISIIQDRLREKLKFWGLNRDVT